MRKSLFLAVLLGFVSLAGCGTTPEDYAGQPGAAQALAKCRADSDMSPAVTNAAANPMFAAAMQQQFINDCMTAKGFRL